MKEDKFIWYPNLLKLSSVSDNKNVGTKSPIRYKKLLYEYREDNIPIIKKKMRFLEIRSEDYLKSLKYWEENLPLNVSKIVFPYSDFENLSNKDIEYLYPEYILTRLPRIDSDGKINEVENEVYIKWFMELQLKNNTSINIDNTIEKIETDLNKSHNKIGLLNDLIENLKDRINFRYKGLPRKSDGRKLNGQFSNAEHDIFHEYDFKGKTPDWATTSERRAKIFLEVKHDIEYRKYLTQKLHELENPSTSLENSILNLEWKGTGAKTELSTLIYALSKSERITVKGTGQPATMEQIKKEFERIFGTSISNVNELVKTSFTTYKSVNGQKPFTEKLNDFIKNYKDQ